MDIIIEIPGNPVPKGRPRFGQGRVYTPKTTKDYEYTVSLLARSELNKHKVAKLIGPVRVDILAVKQSKSLCIRNHFVWRTSTPDGDNVRKAVLDGLNHSGIWKDDAQVVCGDTLSVFGSIGRTIVRISTMEDTAQDYLSDLHPWTGVIPKPRKASPDKKRRTNEKDQEE